MKSVITDQYAIYNADNMDVMATLPDNSIDFSMYSPPFMGLYKYSGSPRDLSNAANKKDFFDRYTLMVKEKHRIMKPGCITAVHCTDVHSITGRLYNFPDDIIRLHEDVGFEYCNRITIWKEPLKVRMRTMVKSLTHKNFVEDSTNVFTAMPDYILIFCKKGERAQKVTHATGVNDYFGEVPMLDEHLAHYGIPGFDFNAFENFGDAIEAYRKESFEALRKKYEGHQNPSTNKFSHLIFQRYMSSVWDDIRIRNVLKFVDIKDDPDAEKHVHPLQLDVCDRLVYLYTNPGDVCFTMFMGVGTEVYSPVSLGRFGIGAELKEPYFAQSVENCANAAKRWNEIKPKTLFD